MGLIRFLYNREFGKRGKACSGEHAANFFCGDLGGMLLMPQDPPRALVVMTHGYNLCAEGYLPVARRFADAGFAVLLFDGTGTGWSGGSAMRGIPQHVEDFLAVLRAVQADPKLGALPLLLYGHSWGAYAADCAAALCAAPVRGVISASAFDDILDVILPVVEHRYGRFLARRCGQALRRIQRRDFGELADLKASECLARLNCPVLVLHAKDDRLVSFDVHFARIRAALEDDPRAVFLTPETGDHDAGFRDESFFPAYIEFFDRCLEQR